MKPKTKPEPESQAVKILCNLDQIAIARNLKPYDIAAMANLSAPTVYDLIANRVSPSMETLSKLANALGVDHSELLRTEDI